jgi:predicted amidophosphoribosyltransferase
MECPHCRLSTSIEDGRCALCGWSLAVCPDCGAANEATARLCAACGRLLVEEEPAEEPSELLDDNAEPHHIY